MKTRAIQRNVHISPRKAKLICDLIKNKKVTEALVILEHCEKRISSTVYKLLNQAISNATNNHAMSGEKLYVYSAIANHGHTLKRTFPRAKGSADLIKKRHSHIEIVVSDDQDERKKEIQKIKDIQKKRALNNKGHKAVQLKQLSDKKAKLNLKENKNNKLNNKKLKDSPKKIIKKNIKVEKDTKKTTKDKTQNLKGAK